jgi:hypothetical protein
MRTSKARTARDEAVEKAIKQGHKPKMLTQSGAMELWVCENGCNKIMDAWDSPAIVNGPMPHVECTGGYGRSDKE